MNENLEKKQIKRKERVKRNYIMHPKIYNMKLH